jgi:hypothetical protein
MIPTKDGGALLGIYSRSSEVRETGSGVRNPETKSQLEVLPPASATSKQSSNFGEGDYWIVKLDKNGKVEWEKNLVEKEMIISELWL